MRRHPLIEEAKSELDVAFDEVRRIELKIMALEQEYNERAQAELAGDDALASMSDEKQRLQEGLDLEGFYALQRRAIARFSAVSAAFAVVGAVEEPGVAAHVLRMALYPEFKGVDRVAAARELKTFARKLREFMFKRADMESEAAVRDAWTAIEDRMRSGGRDL